MKRTTLLWGGVIGPVAYVVATILGGLFTPGYSHVTHSVSELVQAGAANKLWLDPIFLVFGLGVTAFGLGLLALAQSSGKNRRFGAWSAWLWMAVGLSSLLITLFFPMDPMGRASTFAGIMHLVLVGVEVPAMIAALVLAGLWFRGTPGLRRYAGYAFVTAALVLLSGLGPVLAIALGSSVVGLLERVAVGTFLQWLFVMGMMLAPRIPSAAALRT